MGDADSGRASPAAAPDDGSGPAAVDSEAAGPQHAALPPRRQKRSLSPDAEEKESMSDSSDDMDPREDEEQDDDDFEDGHRGKSVTGRAVAKAMDIRSLATEMGAMRKRCVKYYASIGPAGENYPRKLGRWGAERVGPLPHGQCC